MPNVYDFSAATLKGETVSLDSFRDKVLLVVNTASKCGFTPQYQGLEALHRRYAERGFSVLGFPCNQFGGQEPGSDEQIDAFCISNYSVTFPMFGKIDVNGDGAHPLFQHLKKEKPGLLGSEWIKWNFTKFLVDRDGHAVARFSPGTSPDAMGGEIERLLK